MAFLFQNIDRLPLYIAAGVGLATAAAGAIFFYVRYRDNFVPPEKWRKIGELTDLMCYPIKSCAAVRISTMRCSKLGLEWEAIRDRTFMVVTTTGEFITGRQHPKMVLVQPNFEGSIMKLSAPGMIDTEVDVGRLYKITPIKTRVWGQTVNTIDCGEEVARWFSRYILCEDFGLRLMFYPYDHSTRDVRGANRNFRTMLKEDSGALHDATSFMFFNESSLADLNTRLENPVSVGNFRPNFLVKGPAAYEEDEWKWLKIGENVVFRCVKPCTRCIFTNINPETAVRSPDGNPLNTLKGYRKFAKTGESPVLGVHLGLRRAGVISVGDPVYVEG